MRHVSCGFLLRRNWSYGCHWRLFSRQILILRLDDLFDLRGWILFIDEGIKLFILRGWKFPSVLRLKRLYCLHLGLILRIDRPFNCYWYLLCWLVFVLFGDELHELRFWYISEVNRFKLLYRVYLRFVLLFDGPHRGDWSLLGGKVRGLFSFGMLDLSCREVLC